MFNSFRKKINSVILDGLIMPEAYSRQQSAPSSMMCADFRADNHINLRAGTTFLDKQTDEWEELHRLNEDNADQAADIDKTVERLKLNSTQMLDHMTDLNSLLASVPSIVSTLNHCTSLAKDLQANCRQMSQKLFELEDLIEIMDMQGSRLDHQFQMAMYKEKKLMELDEVRKQLVDSHAVRVREYEKKIKQAQLERQAVFQEAFQNDIECYKTLGTIPKVELSKPKSELTLEEVVLDHKETEELIEFLNN